MPRIQYSSLQLYQFLPQVFWCSIVRCRYIKYHFVLFSWIDCWSVLNNKVQIIFCLNYMYRRKTFCFIRIVSCDLCWLYNVLDYLIEQSSHFWANFPYKHVIYDVYFKKFCHLDKIGSKVLFFTILGFYLIKC